MSKQLYADMVVNAVVAQYPTKPRLTKLALQRAVDDGGDTITIMLHGEKANNLMYMIPTSDIRQLLELEPQEDSEPEQPIIGNKNIKIIHQSKKSRHIYKETKARLSGYQMIESDKSLCGKSFKYKKTTEGDVSEITCPKCLEILKAGESHD